MTALLISLAWAGSTLSLDLDGDGTAESIRYDAASGKVHIGSHEVVCDGDPCDLEAHDVSTANRNREVEVCAQGVRDERMCRLYTLEKGALKLYDFPKKWPASDLRTSGNGLVLSVDSYHLRLFERIEKYRAEGYRLVEVKQPIYTAGTPRALAIDRTFQVLYDPAQKTVVANARPKSSILILGEHGEHAEWLLIRLSSGISGWVERKTLEGASTAYMQIMGAG